MANRHQMCLFSRMIGIQKVPVIHPDVIVDSDQNSQSYPTRTPYTNLPGVIADNDKNSLCTPT